MKNYFFTLILGLISFHSIAQEIDETFELNGQDGISIKTDYASLTIHESTGNQIQVKGTVTYNGIPATDAVELEWRQSTGVLYIKTDIKNWSFKEKYDKIKNEEIEKLSKEELIEIVKRENEYGNWDFKAHLDIYLPLRINNLEINSTYGSISMKDIPQNLAIKNTYGAIEASLPSEFESCILNSTYSTVTVELPKSTSAAVQLQSNYGEIYTDVDISIDKAASTSQAYKTIIVGSINRGKSRKLTMRSDYSNIYLKKS